MKSARGEQVEAVDVDREGLRWDRAWACVDQEDGTLGSAKHPGRWGRLLEVSAHVEEPAGAGIVALLLGGRRAIAGTPEADSMLSEHLGRPVRLTRIAPEQPTLHRQVPDDPGLVPEWMVGAVPGQEMLSDVPGARTGRFVDFGPVHLVTTGAIARLARHLGRSAVDAARFRPNLVLDAPVDPEPGMRLRIGGAVLRVVMPTPRCVVPGLAPEGGAGLDRELLGAVARHYRTKVPALGSGACLGVYAEVLSPGRVEVGQPVEGAVG